MLSEEVLKRLGTNEIISLCVYLDIEWRTLIIDSKCAHTWMSDHLVSRNTMIDNILNGKNQVNCIIKYDKSSWSKLYPDSFVLYGEFTRLNPHCLIICNSLSIHINRRTFEYMYEAWSSKRQVTYKELSEAMNKASKCVYGNRSLYKFVELCNQL
jgi:hypothetical protein